MRRVLRLFIFAAVVGAVAILIFLALFPRLAGDGGVNLPVGAPGPVELDLPAGFEADIFARELGRPRFMAYDDEGVLFVADMSGGRVLALPDRNADGEADGTVVVAQGLSNPSSLWFHDGWLYVGETPQVIRLRLGEDLQVVESQVVVPDLPPGGAHVSRTVLLDAGGRLYVSAGSSCNVCEEDDERRAAITIYASDGSGERVFARGLRNAVGLAINPWTGELWATNNGRDWLGDDDPPETVYIVAEGLDAGWPRCHAGRIVDPDFGQDGACQDVALPVVELQAHTAPLGLAFYEGTQFPAEYQGDLFVALHGSWNRSQPVGYKVVRIPLEENRPAGQVLDFASGWRQRDGSVPGRPAGLIVAPDGSLMVSDDKAGLVYRIRYRP
jgi:glucose/arabinose dehydrogenase